MIVFLLLLMPLHHAVANGSDDDDGYEQDFLFLLEEAYTQEKNEWQFGLSYQNVKYQSLVGQPDSTDNRWQLGIEYGLTDRLQIEFSLPYQQSTQYQNNQKSEVATVGNPELEVSYQIFQESAKSPAISIGLGVEFASSTNKEPIRSDSWGYESFINASKYLENWGFVHGGIAYEIAEHGDETELSYGIGFVKPFNNTFSGMVEYLVERESESDAGVTETETSAQFSVGISFENGDGFIAGVAYGQSDNKQVLDQSFSIKIQYEF